MINKNGGIPRMSLRHHLAICKTFPISNRGELRFSIFRLWSYFFSVLTSVAIFGFGQKRN